jgi:hypothetical protein
MLVAAAASTAGLGSARLGRTGFGETVFVETATLAAAGFACAGVFGEDAALPGTDSFSLPGGADATFAIVVTLVMNCARASASMRASSSFKFRLIGVNLDKISHDPIGKTPSNRAFCDTRHACNVMLHRSVTPTEGLATEA